MPVVRINDVTFEHISTLKMWYKTKSPSETIDLIVRDVMEQLGIEHTIDTELATATPKDGVLMFDVAPSLTFTKPTKAIINGETIHNPSWASILHAMIARVRAKGFNGASLIQELGVPSKAAKYEEEGYKYIPELGISVQGQSAADAWKEVDRIATKWQIPITVEFSWRQNPKALHPGMAGILQAGRA